MENDSIRTMRVSELFQKSFFVPKYQRGYRWQEKQVTDLLLDIHSFDPKNILQSDSRKTWYCLQPIVVKWMPERECWEVIDGQQRLTTIYLILLYFKQRRNEEEQIDQVFDQVLFTIEYETRDKSKDFLSSGVIEASRIENYPADNPDFHFMIAAYRKIRSWFKENKNAPEISKFEQKLRDDTRFIWCEVQSGDSEEIFSRLNSGKIPLTDSELVKALLLKRTHYDPEAQSSQAQLEIASEWDNVQHELCNDSFWYFLTKEDEVEENRISLILKLAIDSKGNDLFKAYFELFSSDTNFKENQKKTWRKVKDCYLTLRGWYDRPDWYHKIGYLNSTTPGSLNKLIAAFQFKTKPQFSSHLNIMIRETLSLDGKTIELEDLHYNDSNHRKYLKKILLLHNILTLLQSNEKNSFKFPFDHFHKDKWDIEHVISIKDELPVAFGAQLEWLKQAVDFLPAGIDLTIKVQKFIAEVDESQNSKQDNQSLKTLMEETWEKLSDEDSEEMDDRYVHGVWNLALLNSEINRAYKNAAFPVKRRYIIQADKQGKFIPISTRHLFLKYYSEDFSNLMFWSKNDQYAYLADIEAKLEFYIN